MPQPNLERSGRPVSEVLAKSEYDVLRQLIRDGLAEIWALERYALVAVAAIWTWLFTQSEWRPWMNIAKYIPAALVALAALRCWAVFLTVMVIARYVKERIEPQWGLGWESFNQRHSPRILSSLIAFFWVALVVAAVVVGLFFESAWLIPQGRVPKP